MAGRDPGERPDPRGRPVKTLDRPPGERYVGNAAAATTGTSAGAAWATRRELVGPLARAATAGAIGVAALFVVASVLASTAGLVFVSGLTGAAIGLLLARAAVPGEGAGPERGGPALTRRQTTWLAIALAIGVVGIAAVVTWIWAVQEGGTLGLLDYLFTTFGPFVPGELIAAAIGAAWGATAGPVQG